MKAILVIDEMPIRCEDCPLHYRKRQEIYRCEMTHKNIRLNSKPSWCPLKPMPEKKYLPQPSRDYWFIQVGRNQMIDEILGETE